MFLKASHNFRSPGRRPDSAARRCHDRNRLAVLPSQSFFPVANDVGRTQRANVSSGSLGDDKLMICSQDAGEQGHREQGRKDRKANPVHKKCRSGKEPSEHGQEE